VLDGFKVNGIGYSGSFPISVIAKDQDYFISTLNNSFLSLLLGKITGMPDKRNPLLVYFKLKPE